MRLPKIIDGQKLHFLPSNFKSLLTARGFVSALEPTGDPIRAAEGSGGMAARDRSVYRHGKERVKKREKARDILMEAMQGQPVEEIMCTTGFVEGARKAVIDWYQATGDTERDHLEKHFENIAMRANKDPKTFFSRAEEKINVLDASGIHVSDRGVVRLNTRRLLSEFYDVEQRTALIRPGITRSEME